MDFSELSHADAPRIDTPPPGPVSEEFLALQRACEGNAVSYPRGLPMALRRGRGATVEDMDGNIYLDFFGGAGVMNVGHANPAVLAAAHAQIDELTHSLDIPSPARRELVEVLGEVVPEGLTRLFFGGPTGSDAVETAVKLARHNTGRYPLLAFEGSYHGMTAGALSLCSGAPFKERFLPLIPEVHFVPYSYCYRCPFGREPETCGCACADYLEHVIDDPHSGVAHPAAIIIEAIQGEGGSIVPHPEFLPRIRALCDAHDILLIDDEIQAGFCRTGKMFACEHTGTVPDIMTMSKALGGVGFPISGIAYREELDTWEPGTHIGTFRGNVIAYAAGAAAINFMRETDLAAHAARVGQIMLEMLQEYAAESTIVGEARGAGLMLGVEFVTDRETKQAAPELAREVRTRCHQRGVLIEVGGHWFNVARFLPPLVVTEELARRGTEIFIECVREIEKER